VVNNENHAAQDPLHISQKSAATQTSLFMFIGLIRLRIVFKNRCSFSNSKYETVHTYE